MNAFNRWYSAAFTNARMSGSSTASFVYDGLGRRMSKSIGGNVTQFLYDRLNPVQELDASNAATANLLTGLRIDERFQRTDSTGARDYLTDILGSTLALTDSSGTMQTSYTYEPFGNTTASGAPSTNPFQFTGRENDGTGLYYYRARYYSPTSQHFIAQDPIGFRGGDTNLNAYVGNGPTNRRDPTGKFFVADDIILISIGAVLTGAVIGWLRSDPCASGTEQALNAGGGAAIAAGSLLVPGVLSGMAGAAGATELGAGAIGSGADLLYGALSGGAAGVASAAGDAIAELSPWAGDLTPFTGSAVDFASTGLEQFDKNNNSGAGCGCPPH